MPDAAGRSSNIQHEYERKNGCCQEKNCADSTKNTMYFVPQTYGNRDLFTASLKFHLAMPLAVQLYTSHYLGVSGRYYGLLRLLIPLLKKFRMRAYILSYILVVI